MVERLAACVSVLPAVQSTYRWQGQVEQAEEVLLMIKTRQECLPALQARIPQLHPHQVPELIAVPVVGGLPDYLTWVQAQTGGDA